MMARGAGLFGKIAPDRSEEIGDYDRESAAKNADLSNSTEIGLPRTNAVFPLVGRLCVHGVPVAAMRVAGRSRGKGAPADSSRPG